MNSIISKFSKYSVFPYWMLVCLGLMYFALDRRLDEFTWDKETLLVASDMYSAELSESIIQIEEILLQQKQSRKDKNNGRYEKLDRIRLFYNYLLEENSIGRYSRLVDGIRVTNFDFNRLYNSNNSIGVEEIDFKILYRNYISRYIRSQGCFAEMRKFQPRITFNDSIGMYITKMVHPYHSSRFLMIYRGHAYTIKDFKVQVSFSAQDVDRGFANVIVRDLITHEEIPHKINILGYAFNV